MFIGETLGKIKFLIAIDICLDNLLNHSLQQIKNMLGNNNTLIPLRIDHIVTSNTLKKEKVNSFIIEGKVVQIDAYDFKPKMKYEKYESTFAYPRLAIVYGDLMKVVEFKTSLKKEIEKHNKDVIDYEIKSRLLLNNENDDFKKQIIRSRL